MFLKNISLILDGMCVFYIHGNIHCTYGNSWFYFLRNLFGEFK